jgi:hypothetical protein
MGRVLAEKARNKVALARLLLRALLRKYNQRQVIQKTKEVEEYRKNLKKNPF